MGILLENLKEETLKDKFRKMLGPKPLKDYTEVRKRVLTMIENCKTQADINFLRNDFSSADVFLNQMIKDFPEDKEVLEGQKRWVKSVAIPALNKKEQELKRKNK